jgi:hypothetical protein
VSGTGARTTLPLDNNYLTGADTVGLSGTHA